MKRFIVFLVGAVFVLAVLLGILLLTIAGMLIFAPNVLFKIIKTVVVAVCVIGGISLLLTAVILGVKYITLKIKENRNLSK